MKDIVVRSGGELTRSESRGLSASMDAGSDPASINWVDSDPDWFRVSDMPQEVLDAMQAQDLLPAEMLASDVHAPRYMMSWDRSYGRDEPSRQARGWIVDRQGLIEFRAFRDGDAWIVKGSRRAFRAPALVAERTVPITSGAANELAEADAASWPSGLDSIKVLPATAREKLLSVTKPVFADSTVLSIRHVPGPFGYQASAVSANADELVAVQANRYVTTGKHDSHEKAEKRLTRTPWELTLVRANFPEQIRAR